MHVHISGPPTLYVPRAPDGSVVPYLTFPFSGACGRLRVGSTLWDALVQGVFFRVCTHLVRRLLAGRVW